MAGNFQRPDFHLMINLFLVLTAFSLCFLAGFYSPRKAGWFIILILPLLGPINFKLIPAGFADFTLYRAAFGVTLGVLLKGYNNVPSLSLFKNKYVKALLLFNFIYIIISFQSSLKTIIGSMIPTLIISLFLCFVIIRNEKDLNKLIKIFVWQAAIIGALILIEYFTAFNFYEYFKILDPELSSDTVIISKEFITYTRAGSYRVAGIDGCPIQTGFRLAFLFPLVLWYAQKKNRLCKIPLLLTISGIILLQTRATFVAIFISLIVLFFIITTSFNKNFIKFIKYTLNILLITIILMTIIVYIFPPVKDVIIQFYQYSTGYDGIRTLIYKTDRIPVAIKYLLKNPLLGYGTPEYVYEYVMETQDIPAVLIYFLSGGIIMGFIYSFMIFYMPYSVIKLKNRNYMSKSQKELCVYAGAAFLSGGIVLFTNWVETHLIYMMMLYVSIYKVYVVKVKKDKGESLIITENVEK